VVEPFGTLMEITRISVWQVDLPLGEGSFTWSGGVLDAFDSTLIRIETDSDVIGWGESCPLGPSYLPAYAEGVRGGIAHIAPYLIGEVATNVTALNVKMDSVLRGHPYVKSALDMACWDILGKSSGLPVSTLLGGGDATSVPLYRAISKDTAERMAARVTEYRSQGYSRFQLKVGGEPDEDIERIFSVAEVLGPGEILIADANGGWLVHQAARVTGAIHELDVYLEQPCQGWEQCLSIRRRTQLPFILDESIDGVDALLRGHADSAMDMVNIKVSKLGGLTRAALARDVSVEMGLGLIIEDTCGGDIATAAVAHLAQSTPARNLFASTDLNGYVTKMLADGAPRREGGEMRASDAPGLGVEPRLEELGQPILEFT
jgi:L-alanine-DL-glutamate epimerase-like enolase superfamily enzyme